MRAAKSRPHFFIFAQTDDHSHKIFDNSLKSCANAFRICYNGGAKREIPLEYAREDGS